MSGGVQITHFPAWLIHNICFTIYISGGLIVIVMRLEYLSICEEYVGMEAKLSEDLNLLKRRICPKYLLDKEGIVLAYRKK